jgi:streptogramin lyase
MSRDEEPVMQWRWLRTMVMGIPLVATLACSTEEGDPAGSGGSAGGGSAGGGGPGGGSGAGGTASAACPAAGSGEIEVRITGLPPGVGANLIIGGPLGSRSITEDTTFGEAAGPYVLTPGRVAAPDPIVRTLFDAALVETEFCLADDGTHRVELAYAPVATSHRLWTNNSNGTGNLLGFAASSLTASAEIAPTVSAVAGAGKDVTFDSEGNLWSMGATTADPHLMRFPHALFAASGDKAADRRIDVADVSCLPAMRALAFARTGALWVSTCGRVVGLAAEDLDASGTVTPARVIEGLDDNGDLAFDSTQNLWITDAERVLRFGVERLDADITRGPDVELSIRDAADAGDIVASNLAFDSAGNLWVIDFGGNQISKVAGSDLEATGARSVVSEISITLGVAALLERPAFDESGGLWLALDQNRFGRLGPDQLGTSTGSGAPALPSTIITSPGIGYANRIAFYPAAADLPLHHRFGL